MGHFRLLRVRVTTGFRHVTGVLNHLTLQFRPQVTSHYVDVLLVGWIRGTWPISRWLPGS